MTVGGWSQLGYLTGAVVSAGLMAWIGSAWLVARAQGAHPIDLGKAEMVVTLAGSPDRAAYAEVLVEAGVAPETMSTLVDPYCLRRHSLRAICRTSVRNTIDEAVALRRIFAREGVTTVIVVTSRYHLARARAVFAIVFAGSGMMVQLVARPGEPLSSDRIRREALSYLPSLVAAVLARSVPVLYEWLVRHQSVCQDPAGPSIG